MSSVNRSFEADTRKRSPRFAVRLLATSLTLAAFLALVRSRIVAYGPEGWPGLANVRSFPARVLWSLLASYQDFLYVAAMTLLFAGLLWVGKSHGRLITGAFNIVAAFSLAAALANRLVLDRLGRPLNYQWLYYSDFLRSQEAKNAILADLSVKQILIGSVAIAAMLGVASVLGRVLERIFEPRTGRAVLVLASLAALAYFSIGGILLSRMGWDPFKLSNPVVFFAHSVLTAHPKPQLMARTTSVDSSDFAPRPPRPADSAIGARRGGIRNVVVFVLESVAERYVGVYGAPYGATPNLDAATSRGTVFTRISAHCPSTSSSLTSLLMSIYPSVSYKSLTRENTALRFPSLSSELSGRSYRTAFWSSADSRFAGIDLFLKNRGFDRVDDYRSLPCPGGVLHIGVNNPLLFGMDDRCITDAFRSWMPDPSGPPFFAMLWTMMTHYPYFASGKERDFGVKDRLFNRYLNGLHRGDEALGELLRTLEERHLAESTLVVVVGDHGQAFGDHHQIGHGHNIYEENVHVPLILIAPSLFHGERIATVGGLIDVAPTILDILGIDPPADWQGRSLFRTDRTGRVYIYGPYSGDLFGVREGDRKYIYSAAYDHSELYDLATDPLETHNRAREAPDAVRRAQDRLVAWVQYQYPFLRSLTGGSVE